MSTKNSEVGSSSSDDKEFLANVVNDLTIFIGQVEMKLPSSDRRKLVLLKTSQTLKEWCNNAISLIQEGKRPLGKSSVELQEFVKTHIYDEHEGYTLEQNYNTILMCTFNKANLLKYIFSLWQSIDAARHDEYWAIIRSNKAVDMTHLITKPETIVEVKPQTVVEVKPEAEPEAEVKPEVESEAEVKAETEPEAEVKPEVETETEVKPETETKI
jgi:hypothetical protein